MTNLFHFQVFYCIYFLHAYIEMQWHFLLHTLVIWAGVNDTFGEGADREVKKRNLKDSKVILQCWSWEINQLAPSRHLFFLTAWRRQGLRQLTGCFTQRGLTVKHILKTKATFILQANATQIWIFCHCDPNWMFSWQPEHDKSIFFLKYDPNVTAVWTLMSTFIWLYQWGVSEQIDPSI